jgi:peptide-methionine (S)-S-oxide reductase
MTQERALLAGGCFWGVQDLLRRRDGIISTRVGYSGGNTPNATYRNHGTHAEAVEIIFDPAKITYRQILEFFFQIHDPTTRNRQGNDVGASYRSAIFYLNDAQRRVAEDTIADVEASGLWPGKVVTEVVPAGDFWEAEPNTRTIYCDIPMATPATPTTQLDAAAQGQGSEAGVIRIQGKIHMPPLLQPGAAAPFRARRSDGKTVTLANLRGKSAVLVFYPAD